MAPTAIDWLRAAEAQKVAAQSSKGRFRMAETAFEPRVQSSTAIPDISTMQSRFQRPETSTRVMAGKYLPKTSV